MYSGRHPFTFTVGRAREVLEEIELGLKSGKISSRNRFLSSLLDGLGRFLGTLSAPSMEVPPMQRDDLLVRETVTTPLTQATADIQLASEQVRVLRDEALEIVNLCQAERHGLDRHLARCTALTDSFRLWVSDSDKRFLWVGDTFNDVNKVDPASSVFVDTHTGTVTLKATGVRHHSRHVVRAFLDKEISRGGLPGHNLEVLSPGREAFTGARPEPRPILYGDSKKRSDRLSALWDGRPNSWFEWERYWVPVPQRAIQAGLSYIFDPSGPRFDGIPRLPNWNCYLRWPGEARIDTGEAREGYPMVRWLHRNTRFPGNQRAPYVDREDLLHEIPMMRLGIQIELDQPRDISWIQLTPLLYGRSYPTVQWIMGSNDGEHWSHILTPRGRTFLNPLMNRGVDFTDYNLSASNYEGRGVWMGPSQPVKHLKFILRQDTAYECPLGVGHRFYWNGREGRIQGPTEVFGSFDSTPLKDDDNRDFRDSDRETRQRVRNFFDVFQGYRQAIAIRDLKLEERLHVEEGMLLSRPFRLDRPVRSVSLLVSEEIPPEFPTRQQWIRYEVSHNGEEWKPIVPQEGQLKDSVIRFAQPTRTIYFRALLRRPKSKKMETPLLLSYALKMLPEGV